MMMMLMSRTTSLSSVSRRICFSSWTATTTTTTSLSLVRQQQLAGSNRLLGTYDKSSSSSSRGQYYNKKKRFESRPFDYSLESSRSNNNNNNDDDDNNNRRRRSGNPPSRGEPRDDKNFRDDFRGTRVFVQGVPDWADWKSLKDHFRIAGDVVFASVSMDRSTGASKGCGIVQYETTEMAQKAIKMMRDHPLDDKTPLYVRPDYQEANHSKSLSTRQTRYDRTDTNNDRYSSTASPTDTNNSRRPAAAAPRPSAWHCADDTATDVDADTKMAIERLIQERDAARRQRDYKKSDTIRDQLKLDYDVHMEDRLKQWWIGNAVPERILETKEEGRWGKRKTPWRQIPTNPAQDANVNTHLVLELLTKRDNARQEKDFKSADDYLEQAKTSCYTNTNEEEDGITLLIHDDDRTFRVWTKEKPTFTERTSYYDSNSNNDSTNNDKQHLEPKSAKEQCMDLIDKYQPEKKEEVMNLLGRFPGREFVVLRKLKDKFIKNQ